MYMFPIKEKFVWVRCPECNIHLKPKPFRKCFECNKIFTQKVFPIRVRNNSSYVRPHEI